MTNPLLEAFWNSRILKAPANTRESESSSEMISIYFISHEISKLSEVLWFKEN